MSVIEATKQKWEELALKTFLEMVRAKDGDLEVVAKLSQVLADLDSMKSITTFLREHPEGKKAFQEYPRLGNVDFHQLHKLPANTLGYAYSNHIAKNI